MNQDTNLPVRVQHAQGPGDQPAEGEGVPIRRPRGKAVMSGPGARKGTEERSLRNREGEQYLLNIFREGIFSFFLLLVVPGRD